MSDFYRWEGKNLLLLVHIQPRASRSEIIGLYGERLKIKITAAPVAGQANAEACVLLAKYFGVAKSQVSLLKGQKSRDKYFCVQSPRQLPDFIKPA